MQWGSPLPGIKPSTEHIGHTIHLLFAFGDNSVVFRPQLLSVIPLRAHEIELFLSRSPELRLYISEIVFHS